jgi:hypothetical protein
MVNINMDKWFDRWLVTTLTVIYSLALWLVFSASSDLFLWVVRLLYLSLSVPLLSLFYSVWFKDQKEDW